MIKAHIAGKLMTGSANEDMVEISDQACVCGLRLVPLVGKIVRDQLRWDVWIEGNYEHFERPEDNHTPKPIGEWK